MEHHLARCPACRSFAEELEGVTETLREADLVVPPIQFELPHRPSRFGVSRAGATAAAAVLVSVALGGVAGLGPDGPSTSALNNVSGDQDRVTLAEHFSLVLDGSSAETRVTSPGVSAAEWTTLGLRTTPEPSRRPASAGGRSPATEGW